METSLAFQFVESPVYEQNPDIFQQLAESQKKIKKNFDATPNHRHVEPGNFLFLDPQFPQQSIIFSDNGQSNGQANQIDAAASIQQDFIFKTDMMEGIEGMPNYQLDQKAKQKRKYQEKETQDDDVFIALSDCGEIDGIQFQAPQKEEQNVGQTKREQKAIKMKRKISKFVLKSAQFKGSDKISLPKKLGKLFINYMDKFQCGDPQVNSFNENIKNELKQNVKNDYTFEKTIFRFLGEHDALGGQINEELKKKISHLYRKSTAQIIKNTMKDQVIMKQKIERNRKIYMLQLKVYYLRCRSHRLAQKGSFK